VKISAINGQNAVDNKEKSFQPKTITVINDFFLGLLKMKSYAQFK